MRLTLCGAVQLAVNGETDAAPLAAKSLALLAFLSLEPGEHSRNELSGLLWGESTEEKAHASLRQALKQLRTVLGDRLDADRQTISVVPSLASDVSEFLTLATEGDERAADVEIPRFLSGLAVRDAQPFEEWADRTRQSLVLKFRRALNTAAKAAHARRDWPRALELAGRLQQLDPLSDDATHFHVEVLYLMGQRDAALGVYREFRLRREREGGAPPGLALRQLATRIEDAR